MREREGVGRAVDDDEAVAAALDDDVGVDERRRAAQLLAARLVADRRRGELEAEHGGQEAEAGRARAGCLGTKSFIIRKRRVGLGDGLRKAWKRPRKGLKRS